MRPLRSPVRSMDALRKAASARGPVRVAIAAPHDPETLQAAFRARESGLAEPILVGDPGAVERGLAVCGRELGELELVPASDPHAAAAAAVGLVREASADLLLKGALPTSTLLHAALDPQRGLRARRLLSDVFIFEYRSVAGCRLVGITDGGVVPRPDLDEKEVILHNAVDAFRALGVDRPCVAILAPVETVTATFPSTTEARELARRCAKGGGQDFIADGPIAIDLALSPEAARRKGFSSPVAGKADILVFPDLVSANMSAKSIEYVARIEPAHCILGAAAPILIPSRSDSAASRLLSIAFGALVSN